MAISNLQNYVAYHHQRRDQATEQRYARYGLGHLRAQEAAAYLKTTFAVETVWLFGSMLTPENVYLESDIDLAVKGLSLEDYCSALGELLVSIKEFSIDLVRIESAPESLQTVIYEQGLML